MDRRHRISLGVIVGSALIVAGSAIFAGVSAARERNRTNVRVRIEWVYRADESLTQLMVDSLGGKTVPLSDGRDGTVETFTPEATGPAVVWDVAIGPSDPLYAPVDEGPIAIDPYVLAMHRDRSSNFEVDASLNELIATLRDAAVDGDTPLIVAGEEPIDFAAFLLYLAGELLDSDEMNTLRLELWPTEPREGEITDELIDELVLMLEPVVETVGRWRDAGVLAENWTRWDRAEAVNAFVSGYSSAAFILRSETKVLNRSGDASLVQRRVPPVRGREQYRMIGRTTVVRPGPGARAEAYPSIYELLYAEEVLLKIEAETTWTSNVEPDSAINAEHQQVVNWYYGAQEYVEIDLTIALHPVFPRLHFLLR